MGQCALSARELSACFYLVDATCYAWLTLGKFLNGWLLVYLFENLRKVINYISFGEIVKRVVDFWLYFSVIPQALPKESKIFGRLRDVRVSQFMWHFCPDRLFVGTPGRVQHAKRSILSFLWLQGRGRH